MNTTRSEHGREHEKPNPQLRVVDHGSVSLDSVLITEELTRRPSRPPNYEAENRALVALAREMASSPQGVLQKLVEIAMELCRAHSAGVSLLESEKGVDVFRWEAIAGQFAANLGGSMVRDLSPCGIVLDRNSVLLFGHPERHFNYPIQIEPPIVEALLIPFHLEGKPVGTLWIIAHDESCKFDSEDARILENLGRMAASAYQVLRALEIVQTRAAERERAQLALIQSEKLASVGRMAATIAHEINNPLSGAMNSLFLASSTEGVPEFARSNLNIADRELRRVAHIAKQALGFYREAGTPAGVHLPEVLDGTLDLYAPKLHNKHARVERRYRGPSDVHGIEGELRQIISNLIANSVDALGDEGVLRVRTTSSKRAVRLTIADTGIGIAPEHIKDIFEPFFTTKQSVGTGLGLWVTKELVNKHAGRIRIRSRVGKGTVFSIWLPTERRRSVRDSSRVA